MRDFIWILIAAQLIIQIVHFSIAVASDGAEAEPGADASRRAREAELDEGGHPRVGAQGQPEDARQARSPQHATGRRGTKTRKQLKLQCYQCIIFIHCLCCNEKDNLHFFSDEKHRCPRE